MTERDLIKVKEQAEASLLASGAELTICISGQSFFTGSEAFKKAAEVNRCVEAIRACGVEQSDISIDNVSIQVESGILAKSSSATYYLSVKCRVLDSLGCVLAAIAAQKNTRLSLLRWTYDSLAATKSDLLQTAVKKAKSTADAIAASLGTVCLGAHSLSYEFSGVNERGYADATSAYDGIKRKRAASAAPLEQLSVMHTSKLSVQVVSEFVVAPFAESNAG